MTQERDCNICVYSARNGDCRKWDCEGTKKVEDIKADAIDEITEKYFDAVEDVLTDNPSISVQQALSIYSKSSINAVR